MAAPHHEQYPRNCGPFRRMASRTAFRLSSSTGGRHRGGPSQCRWSIRWHGPQRVAMPVSDVVLAFAFTLSTYGKNPEWAVNP
jgi:hypothetical protein